LYLLVTDADALILILNDFLGQGSVIEAPQSNALSIDRKAVASGCVEDLQDVVVFEQAFEAAVSKEALVYTGPEEIDVVLTGLHLNKTQCWQIGALKCRHTINEFYD
jgi:hypothetical protein